jgi:hypothetical protein
MPGPFGAVNEGEPPEVMEPEDETPAGSAATLMGGGRENPRSTEEDEREGETGVRGRARLQATDHALSLADTPAAVSALDLVAGDALATFIRDAEARAAWLGPVQAALREAFGDLAPDDVEGFKQRVPLFQASLPRVLEAMDSDGLERALSEGMLAAMVNGFESAAVGAGRGR